MAFAKDGIKTTYLEKSKYDDAGSYYREVVEKLNEIYNSMLTWDGSAWQTIVTKDSTEAEDIWLAIAKMQDDILAYYVTP